MGIVLAPEVHIKNLVDQEFADKARHFEMRAFSMDALGGDEFEKTKTAGVYVFWHEQHRFIKVGKSQSNASKRAREHLRDNTKSKHLARAQVQMRDLQNDPQCKLVVLNVDSKDNMHWILALEYFLEHQLNPCISSVRNG